jgi:flagellar biosynthetic protein FliR
MTFALPDLAAAFLLAFARIGTMVMLLPGIGERMLPVRIRLAVALLLTLVILPGVRPLLAAATPAAALGLLIGEIAVGAMLGLAVRAVMAALQTAGNVIAAQIGLSYAMTVDPTAGSQEAAIGNFLALLGVTLVFATDLHHLAIAAIQESYALLPPARPPDTGDAARLGVMAVARGFALGLKIAAPFIAFAILFNLGLGVLSRLMPQLQVFFLALPLSVLVGMLILLASLGLMMNAYLLDLGDFLKDMGGR